MGWDDDFGMAFLKSQLGAGVHLPDSGTVFVSLRDTDKQGIVPAIRKLTNLGFSIVVTHARTYARDQIVTPSSQRYELGLRRSIPRGRRGALHTCRTLLAGSRTSLSCRGDAPPSAGWRRA